MSDWKPVGVVAEGEAIDLLGVNPWSHNWKKKDDSGLRLPHPSYPQQLHALDIYEIEMGGRRICFAAGELSANVWGFYVPA
ncbi:hypothetical protein E4K72_19830 [Oxalobacteraceae bacterium OM1]|nr:hypothetical protein E4K72_19830 [Oxalobacteraceae bacterium OM1]